MKKLLIASLMLVAVNTAFAAKTNSSHGCRTKYGYIGWLFCYRRFFAAN